MDTTITFNPDLYLFHLKMLITCLGLHPSTLLQISGILECANIGYVEPILFVPGKLTLIQIYRPPTPPRPSDHKRRGLLDRDTESQNLSASSMDRRPRFVEIPVCRSEGMYAWSIGTGDSYSRRESSVSLPSSEWQVAERDSNTHEHDQRIWWDKIKSLGVLIKNRMKGFKEYGAFC